jgi:YHS domain-containing protein
MNIRKTHTLRVLGFAVLSVSFLIVSCSSTKPAVNAGPGGIAIKGYDTVAYFTMGKPVKGSDQFSHEWSGAKWIFANREHRDLFAADPDKYAPQYGGY